MPQSFDPKQHLRTLADGRDHLDLKWQLVWLRAEYPDARIETQLVAGDDDLALCRALVEIPNGGSATGHGSATRDDGEVYVEAAEDRALARALARLGFGAEYEPEDDIEPEPLLRPPVELITARTLAEREENATDDERGDVGLAGEPVVERDQSPVEETDDDVARSGEDVSWSKFWEWAKPRGYQNAQQLSEMLGVEVLSLTPMEVRRRLKRYELDHPPGSHSE